MRGRSKASIPRKSGMLNMNYGYNTSPSTAGTVEGEQGVDRPTRSGAGGKLVLQCYCRPCTSASTTEGSASVEVSPRFSISPSAILRRIRRMIFPERVLGRAEVN